MSKPKMKNSISDVALGAFLIDCMTVVNESLNISKKLIEKHTCQICQTRHEEIWTCETCGKRACADHMVREHNPASPYDDFKDTCTECIQERCDKS